MHIGGRPDPGVDLVTAFRVLPFAIPYRARVVEGVKPFKTTHMRGFDL